MIGWFGVTIILKLQWVMRKATLKNSYVVYHMTVMIMLYTGFLSLYS